ncbi:hypothetical protein LTR36_005977 [Oleoguttula mirabilis]|uniref:alpha-amylase n=1 Tax=Oleoguttula mirabilis TaxID=1507867 RepID=A0AAV9JDP8_9PEZI|nr:hypothetical protein LTR36_005977 [Oleoguttula mirabilis]
MATPLPHARFATLGLLLFSFFLGSSLAASAAEWRTRSIYQILTDRFVYGDGTDGTPPTCGVLDGLYCGGTWQGIKSRLDYITGMGFDAIWISPIVQNLDKETGDGEAYTGYWAHDIYALNSHFGTEDDLKELIAELHARDMLLMLDIVVNHMGYAGAGEDVDYSVFNPFNDEKYFHDYCEISDDTNQTNVEVCWLGDDLVTLVDLRTEDDDVQAMLGTWISSLVTNYSIDGLRIDTSLNVEPSFFADFVSTAGIFATGEVMSDNDTLACTWSETIGSILNYPIYYTLTAAFESNDGSIDDLVETINSVKGTCGNSTSFGSFSENHDVARFASLTDDLALAKNIITYTFLADGIPIIYQGQEQRQYGSIDPYYNRAPLWEASYNKSSPLYEHIATLNQFRQHVISVATNYTEYMAEVIYQDTHSLATRKGFNGTQVITLMTNTGEDAEYTELSISGHGFSAGTVLTEILTCTNLTVNATGYLIVPTFAGTPKVLYPAKHLKSAALCGSEDASEPLPSATTVTTAVHTTINGQATAISTTEVIPLSTATAKTSTRALGAADSLSADMSLVGSVAVLATVATTGYRVLGPLSAAAGTRAHHGHGPHWS